METNYPIKTISERDRIRNMTPESVNKKIDYQAQQHIAEVRAHGRSAIYGRLKELEMEWDIDRVLMVNFAAIVFAQLIAARKDKRWLWGPLVQTPFLFMHATLGWCPPSLWFRPMGFRTKYEIQAEREALLDLLRHEKAAA